MKSLRSFDGLKCEERQATWQARRRKRASCSCGMSDSASGLFSLQPPAARSAGPFSRWTPSLEPRPNGAKSLAQKRATHTKDDFPALSLSLSRLFFSSASPAVLVPIDGTGHCRSRHFTIITHCLHQTLPASYGNQQLDPTIDPEHPPEEHSPLKAYSNYWWCTLATAVMDWNNCVTPQWLYSSRRVAAKPSSVAQHLWSLAALPPNLDSSSTVYRQLSMVIAFSCLPFL